MNLEFVPLEGRYVRLEPLVAANKEELRAALDCDPESWEIMSVNGCGEGFEDWWGAMRGESQRKTRQAYAIRRLADGKLVGTTSFLNIRTIHAGVEVGATFIAPDARSGPINPESKKLLLGQAFDAGAVRVEFMIDTRNVRSQAAVEKLGAEKEGVMRKHKITWTGYVRDTAVFSITDTDWPGVEARLDYRLQEDFV
jgi:RimJ/RimL family protein N-acetyltransferase